ncbi:MAG: radical SAM protein [Alphaproteobacteria bacterium]|nr:radical SAM protein [Alphaproteobacteria bacterium]
MPDVFRLVVIKPTRYDDQGYPIQWWRSTVPSNSLACIVGLARDCNRRRVLGHDVEIVIEPVDEGNRRVEPEKIAREIGKGNGLVALAGVQTNQFPRALDLARKFRALGIPVCVGGFHVSGVYAMLKMPTPEIEEALAMGVSLFLGEAEEGRLDQVLRDAAAGSLKPVYDYLNALPNIAGEPIPFLPRDVVKRTVSSVSSFDVGRGCPFQCSFCTIINVQGRKSRFRTGADLEAILKANLAEGIDRFFVTDDNLARNKNWEELFDTIIRVMEETGRKLFLTIQVDTLCHHIAGFIEKAVKAGVHQVFVGLENINSDNLQAVKKKQNRITDYREMLLAWKKHPVMISAGYIVGFPNDTRQSLLNDIEIIKRELPLDFLFLNYLTPLPGCEDHRRLVDQGVWMDPDLNKYDLLHRVTKHPVMSDEEADRTYSDLWARYYCHDHMVTVLRRAYATGQGKAWRIVVLFTLLSIYNTGYFRHYRFEWGLFPRRYRKDRRPGRPIESPLVFYPRLALDLALFGILYAWRFGRLRLALWRIRRDPHRDTYRDAAVTPPDSHEFEDHALYHQTRGADEAVERAKRRTRRPIDA